MLFGWCTERAWAACEQTVPRYMYLIVLSIVQIWPSLSSRRKKEEGAGEEKM